MEGEWLSFKVRAEDALTAVGPVSIHVSVEVTLHVNESAKNRATARLERPTGRVRWGESE